MWWKVNHKIWKIQTFWQNSDQIRTHFSRMVRIRTIAKNSDISTYSGSYILFTILERQFAGFDSVISKSTNCPSIIQPYKTPPPTRPLWSFQLDCSPAQLAIQPRPNLNLRLHSLLLFLLNTSQLILFFLGGVPIITQPNCTYFQTSDRKTYLTKY